MKVMTVFEAKNQFSRALEIAAAELVVVTRHGKPVATIQGITEDDLEDLLLERSAKFWEMIERARKGRSLSLERVEKALASPSRRKPGRSKPSRRAGVTPRRGR